jgi:hypothetical protein
MPRAFADTRDDQHDTVKARPAKPINRAQLIADMVLLHFENATEPSTKKLAPGFAQGEGFVLGSTDGRAPAQYFGYLLIGFTPRLLASGRSNP